MSSLARGRRTTKRGFVLAVTAALIVVLCGFAGLALDAGYLFYMRSRAQTAADSAALAGLQSRKRNLSNYVAVGKESAALNGFTDGKNRTLVTVTSPPSSGYYAGNPMAVEATVSRTAHTFFLGVLNIATMTAPARAVTRLGPSPSCVYALDPAMSGAFSVNGSASVTLDCGVQINSSSSSALNVAGSGCLTATAYNVVGNYTTGPSACALGPAPNTGASHEEDPLAYLSPPPVHGGCDYTNFKQNSGAVTLSPGVYCGGIRGQSGAVITLLPGVYIIMGGYGLDMQGSSSISGTGVTFYITQGAGYSYAPVSLNGGGTVSVRAPKTGPYAGIAFFQDRSVVSGAPSIITGTSSMAVEGALYFRTTQLTYAGGSEGGAAYTAIVANNLQFSGNAMVRRDYSSLPGGSPIRGAVILGE